MREWENRKINHIIDNEEIAWESGRKANEYEDIINESLRNTVYHLIDNEEIRYERETQYVIVLKKYDKRRLIMSGESYVTLYATPNLFLLNKILLNKMEPWVQF